MADRSMEKPKRIFDIISCPYREETSIGDYCCKHFNRPCDDCEGEETKEGERDGI